MFAVHPPLQVLAITCFALGECLLIAYVVIILGYLEEYLGKCLDKLNSSASHLRPFGSLCEVF